MKKQTFLKKNRFIHNKKNFYTFLILIKYSYVRVVIDLNFCMMISKIINKSFDWFEFLISKDFQVKKRRKKEEEDKIAIEKREEEK